MAASPPATTNPAELDLPARLVCRDREIALRGARTIGCTTVHEHQLGGLTVYMACDGMGQFAWQFAKNRPVQATLLGVGGLMLARWALAAIRGV